MKRQYDNNTKLYEETIRHNTKTLCYDTGFNKHNILVGVKRIPQGLKHAVPDMRGQIGNGVLNKKTTNVKQLEHLRDVYTLISIVLEPLMNSNGVTIPFELPFKKIIPFKKINHGIYLFEMFMWLNICSARKNSCKPETFSLLEC